MSSSFDGITLADFFKDFPEGVVCLAQGGVISEVNDAFRHIAGLSPQEVPGNIESIIHPKDLFTWRSLYTQAYQSDDKVQRTDLRLTGETWARVVLIRCTHKDPPVVLAVFNDISASKALEANLLRTRDEAERAVKIKSEFLANTSHEIRTPIHTIIGMAELLKETSLDQEQDDYTSHINFSADVLLSLINDILDFSKMEAGQLTLEKTSFELTEMIEKTIDLVTLGAHKKGVDIGLYLDPRLPDQVVGDPVRLRQVLINLINNAVKFTHQGQVVLIVEVQNLLPARCDINFSVADSGIGIPKEKLQNLFQAFHQADSSTTRKYGGTGLGLFISQSLVLQMGGTLAVDSQEGVGSTFSFALTLPFGKGSSSLHPVLPRDFYEETTALVVDDNPVIRSLLIKSLEDWGILVMEADGGVSALNLMRQQAQKGRGFDLVFIDQAMPGMDGWQLASEIHSEGGFSQSNFILMSQKGGRGTGEAKMKLLGWFDGYMTKPIHQTSLAEKIFWVLNKNEEIEDPAELELIDDHVPFIKSEKTPKAKILVAEDHEVNRELFKTILNKLQYQVMEAVNGKEAWEKSLSLSPDLIFMDCQMPQMNGYESTRKIRQAGLKMPIIAVTASAIPEERGRCLAAGMTDLVTKPFKKRDIEPFLKKYLGNDPAPGGTEASAPPAQEPRVQESPSSAIFDYPAALETFLGNKEAVHDLLEPLMQKMEEQLRLLARDFDGENWEGVRQTAHAIKGSSLNMNMSRVARAAGDLEGAAKTQNAGEGRAAMNQLKTEVHLCQGAVKDVLAREGLTARSPNQPEKKD